MSKKFNNKSTFGTLVHEFFKETLFDEMIGAFLEVENISQKNNCTDVKQNLEHTLESQNQSKTPLESKFSSEKEEVSVTQRGLSKSSVKPDNNDSPSAKDENWKCMEHILWTSVTFFILVHLGAAYGAYIAFTTGSRQTIYFALLHGILGGLGVTAGVHRLWTHKAYKAKLPLRIFLAYCNTIAMQFSIYEWSSYHRLHHKYCETDADPYNSNRGFFFSQIGWLCCQKHPDVKRFAKKLDFSDLWNDPVVYYQRKYYMLLVFLGSFVLPPAIACYFWNESVLNAFFVVVAFPYCFGIHVTGLVNSAAHMYGYRPYDKSIAPTENLIVSALAFGEGYHNFHHAFPWDYSTSEWGWRLNLTTMFLDVMGHLGQVYDARIVTPEMIEARKARTGNKSCSH